MRQFEVRIPLIVVLFLIIGAGMTYVPRLIPASSAVRARFTPTVTPSPVPVDPFAALEFEPFSNPVATIQLDRPAAWEAVINNGLGSQAYTFRVPGTLVSVGVALLPETIVINRLFQLRGVTVERTPSELVALVIQTLPPAEQVRQKMRPLTVGSLTGAALRAEGEQTLPDGTLTPVFQEIWLLELDPTHVALILAIAPTPDRERLQVVLDRLEKSLKIDVVQAIKVVDTDFPAEAALSTVTPEATEAEATGTVTATP